MENQVSGIAQKIVNVMSAVESVVKDKTNDFHKYDYASDAAILTAIRKAMIDNKLVAIPNQLSCLKEGDITTIQVEYTLMDAATGTGIKSIVYGQGQDKMDKGAYKAATGAEKYFFLKTFLIPTLDDPEDEKLNKKEPPLPAKKKESTPPPPPPAAKKKELTVIEKAKQEQVKAVIKKIESFKTVDEANDWLATDKGKHAIGLSNKAIAFIKDKFNKKQNELMKAEGFGG